MTVCSVFPILVIVVVTALNVPRCIARFYEVRKNGGDVMERNCCT